MRLPARVRGLRGEIWRSLRTTSLPVRVRLDLVTLAVAKRVAAPTEWPVHLPLGAIYLSGSSLREDTEVIYEVLGRELYKTRFEGAVVVDIGAHHGYFSAYALWHGARAVFSYEPEAHNYALLARAAGPLPRDGRDWHTYHAAVSSAQGRAALHTTKESWTHSLVHSGAASGVQEVAVVAMTDVLSLADAAARPVAAPVIVKVDTEGGECSIILDTPLSSWQGVAELFVEVHAKARCSKDAIVAHLGRAGLAHRETRDECPDHVLLLFRQRGRSSSSAASASSPSAFAPSPSSAAAADTEGRAT
jgi:FkbM family methyltransferase